MSTCNREILFRQLEIPVMWISGMTVMSGSKNI